MGEQAPGRVQSEAGGSAAKIAASPVPDGGRCCRAQKLLKAGLLSQGPAQLLQGKEIRDSTAQFCYATKKGREDSEDPITELRGSQGSSARGLHNQKFQCPFCMPCSLSESQTPCQSQLLGRGCEHISSYEKACTVFKIAQYKEVNARLTCHAPLNE